MAPASADGNYNVTANSEYTTTVAPIGVRKAEAILGVYTMPHPPTKDHLRLRHAVDRHPRQRLGTCREGSDQR